MGHPRGGSLEAEKECSLIRNARIRFSPSQQATRDCGLYGIIEEILCQQLPGKEAWPWKTLGLALLPQPGGGRNQWSHWCHIRGPPRHVSAWFVAWGSWCQIKPEMVNIAKRAASWIGGPDPADGTVPRSGSSEFISCLSGIWGFCCCCPSWKKGEVRGQGRAERRLKEKEDEGQTLMPIPTQSLCTQNVIQTWPTKGHLRSSEGFVFVFRQEK